MKTPSLTDRAFDKPLNSSLGLLSNELAFTVRGRLTATTTADANAGDPNVVAHDLGRVPEGFAVIDNDTTGATFYALATDKVRWTADQIVVRCSSASAKFRLMVLTQD